MGKCSLFIVIYIYTCITIMVHMIKIYSYYLKADRERLYMYLLIISSMIWDIL